MATGWTDRADDPIRKQLNSDLARLLGSVFPTIDVTNEGRQTLGLVCGFASGRDCEDRLASETHNSEEWLQITLDEIDVEIVGLSFDGPQTATTPGKQLLRLQRYRYHLIHPESNEDPGEYDHGIVIQSLTPTSVPLTNIDFVQASGITSLEFRQLMQTVKWYVTSMSGGTDMEIPLYTVAYQAEWGNGTLKFLALQDDDDIRAALGELGDW